MLTLLRRLVRSRFRFVRSQVGMTLVEILIGVGLLSIVGVVGSTVTLMVVNQLRDEAYEAARREIRSNLSNATRGPRQLREALGSGSPPLVPCLKIEAGPQPVCNASAAFVGFSASTTAIAGGPPLTNANGVGCMGIRGEPCAVPASGICPANCPVRITTDFRMACTGTRPTCPSNQANLIVRYSVAPETTAADRDKFRPIRAVQVIQPKTLWGDINKLPLGAAAVELSSEPSKQVVSCANGSIMTGIDANGQPICEVLTDLNQKCGAGTVFAGYTVDATQRLVATCRPSVCDPLGGKQRVFAGYTAAGAIICNVINSTNAVCNPGTSGAPTGMFMTGIDPNGGAPICMKKTCLPGEIFARLDAQGRAVCKKTDPWIPRCPAGPCTAPPATDPPPVGTFYTDTTTPAVAVGYNGIPWISQWGTAGNEGEPMQGYRMTFKNFTGSSSVPTVGGLFADSLAGLGLKTCQLNGAANDTSKHFCQHSVRRVTRAVGSCSGSYTFSAPNTCSWTTAHPSFGCQTAETSLPSGPGCVGSCGTPYNASCAVVAAAVVGRCCTYNTGTFSEPSEQTQTINDPIYAVTGYNFNNGSNAAGTADCSAGAATAFSGNTSGSTPTGFPQNTYFNDSYTAQVRASCNYQYNSP